MAKDFSVVKSALVLVACADGDCKKGQSVSNESVSIARTRVEKTGGFGSKASIDGELKQTLLNNPACVGNQFRAGIAAIQCSLTADAANKPGDIFVADTSAIAFGLLYDGEDAILLRAGLEDEGKIYKTPEPLTILGTSLALGFGVLLKTRRRFQVKSS